MTSKKSKITSVIELEEWTGNHGTFYPHQVSFENGDIAIANKKAPNSYTVGTELHYEIVGQDQKGNNKFKEVQQEGTYKGFNKGGGKKGGSESFALSYAKDIAVAKIQMGFPADADLMNDIIKTAGIFLEWLNKQK